MDFIQIAKNAKEASLKIADLSTEIKNKALIKIADEIEASKSEIFDVYEGVNIGIGRKSLAYSLSFGAQDRTLTDEEANEVLQKIIERLEKILKAELRS